MGKCSSNSHTLGDQIMGQDSNNPWHTIFLPVRKLTAIFLLLCTLSLSGCTLMFTRTFDRIPMSFTFEEDGSCSLTIKGKHVPQVRSLGNIKGDPSSFQQHSWTCEVVTDEHSEDSFYLNICVPYYWVSLSDISLDNAYAVKGTQTVDMPQGEGDQTVLFARIRSAKSFYRAPGICEDLLTPRHGTLTTSKRESDGKLIGVLDVRVCRDCKWI